MTKRNPLGLVLLMSIPVLMVILNCATLSSAEPQMISKEELRGMMDSKELIILDVRAGKDWSSAEFKIKGAVRADPHKFSAWAEDYPKERKLVLY